PDPLPPTWGDLAASPGKLRADLNWLGASARKPFTWLLLLGAAALLWVGLGPAYSLLVLLAPLVVYLLRYLGRLVLNFFGAIARTLFEATDAVTNWVKEHYVNSLSFLLKRS